MATIIPNQDFKHGAETYKKGESYEVSDEDAEYFERAGWTGHHDRTIVKSGVHPDGSQWLVIHDAVIGHSSEVN